MSAVRPELGPTLPELLGPRLGALSRPVRLALAAAAAIVLILAWALLLRGDGADTLRPVVVREPVALNFVFRAPFARQPLQPGELARVGAGAQSLSVRELRLPAYRGDAAGFLPLWVARQEAQMARRFPGFLPRQDGRTNVNRIQGYELYFQFRRDGRTAYGRRVLLLPTVTSRQGVDLLLVADRSTSIPRFDAVGRNGGLKTTLRSFRFGTERP